MRCLCRAAVVVLALQTVAAAQTAPIPFQSGQGVTPSFEGWFKNPDGTISLSFGYMNRNYREELDIPVGGNNKIEPGPPDQGQPTHFLPRRQTGIFTVVVPKDFPAGQRVTWTLTAHGQTVSVPGHLRPEWEIDALKESTSGNTPPVVRFESTGKSGQGPAGIRTTLRGTLSAPVKLTLWVNDDDVRKRETEGRGPSLGLSWSKFRGPGKVSFSNVAPKIDGGGRSTTTASFSEPGDYVLRVLAWDASGSQGPIMAGGFQCCWTNAYARVTVNR